MNYNHYSVDWLIYFLLHMATLDMVNLFCYLCWLGHLLDLVGIQKIQSFILQNIDRDLNGYWNMLKLRTKAINLFDIACSPWLTWKSVAE